MNVHEAAVKASGNGRVHLTDIWDKLSGICQRLWNENSPTAIAMQVAIDEFKSDIGRADGMIESTALALAEKEREFDAVLVKLSEKDRQNQEFRDQYLKSAVERDHLQAQKMEAFYQQLKDKESALETGWIEKRHKIDEEHRSQQQFFEKRQREMDEEFSRRTLQFEEDHAKRQKELDAIHDRLIAEMDEWESRRFKEEHALHEKREQLDSREHELAAEYRKKQLELQAIKENLQREVGELVRQYQARIKGGA